MSRQILPLAILYSLYTAEAFAPHRQSKPSTSLSAQRTDKKRRFLQSAHPISKPASSADRTNAKDRWGTPSKASSAPVDNRIKPPLQTSKSIDELEAILERRWGTADAKDDEVAMSFEDTSSESKTTKKGPVVKSRRVRDPWEKMSKRNPNEDEFDDVSSDEEGEKQQRWYNRDEAMLKRVKSNQTRLKDKNKRYNREDGMNVVPIGNKDYYDQDDEGYENDGSMIAPRPAGGRGRTGAALESGIFSARNEKVRKTKEAPVAVKEEEVVKKKRPKRKEPQLEAVLDEDGNPMYLTLDQAERIVENILSSDSESNSPNSDIVDWEDVGITNPQLLDNLQSDEMICPSPLEVQIKSCPPIIAGNDVLLSTHTGSGKTLAFLAPIAQNIMVNPSKSTLPQALIIAPGRELASQIVSVAQTLFEGTDLTVGMVIGGTSYARNVEMLRNKKPNVVVGTPGRVAELILGRTGDKGGKLKLSNLQTIVLDEFDALLQYDAHKEPTNAIIEAIDRQHPSGLQRVLCSATATDMMTESDNSNVENYLRPGYAHAKIDESDLLVTSGVNPNAKGKATRVSKTTIHGALHVTHQRYALDAVRRVLNTDPVIQQALIFVDSPRRVEIVIEKLAQMDIVAAPLHGGASAGKGDRAEVSKALREGFVGVVVATEMAARGLDAPYLTHVINLDLPTDASHFAHRVGRCGRGGRPGVAISITCNDREKGVPKRFADELGITMHDVEAREGKIRIVKR